MVTPDAVLRRARALYEARRTGVPIPPLTDEDPTLGIADWRIKLDDTVADLASNGALVVSDRVVPIDDFDPRLVGMVLSRNGEVVGTGVGAAALGDPLAVVAWLANTLGEHGVALAAGHLVMTGSLHAPLPLAAGDVFTAGFDRLGAVTLRVTPWAARARTR